MYLILEADKAGSMTVSQFINKYICVGSINYILISDYLYICYTAPLFCPLYCLILRKLKNY